MGHLLFESVDAFRTSFGSHRETVIADIPEYTNSKPTIQINEGTLTALSFAKLLLLLLSSTGAVVAQISSTEWKVPKPGVKDAQVPFASLSPSATIKIGGTADWVLITDDAVWVASTKPYAVQRIDPATNWVVATIRVSGEACSGLAYGFGSIWVPLCGKPKLVRIDAAKNTISASEDRVWLVTDKNGTLNRIDASTNSVRPKIFNPTRFL